MSTISCASVMVTKENTTRVEFGLEYNSTHPVTLPCNLFASLLSRDYNLVVATAYDFDSWDLSFQSLALKFQTIFYKVEAPNLVI
mgnify:CR=1 FL=1